MCADQVPQTSVCVREMSGAPTVQNKQNMIISKTETEYNMKSIRFLLLTITTMFIVIGSLMIVLGISVYSHYHDFSFFYESAKAGRFLTPSVLCVFLGFMLLVVSSFGFFGSLRQSTCMVNLYALILITIFTIKLVLVILAFTVEAATVMKYIYIPIDQYVQDPEIQDEIDSLQTSLNCCGANSYMDYIGLDFTGNHSTIVVSDVVDGDQVSVVVPRSCCASGGDVVCARMFTTGCRAALVNAVVQNTSVLGVLGVSVMFIMLLGITFALLLARCIRKLKSERALMAWRIREQLILARQEATKLPENTLYITPTESSMA